MHPQFLKLLEFPRATVIRKLRISEKDWYDTQKQTATLHNWKEL